MHRKTQELDEEEQTVLNDDKTEFVVFGTPNPLRRDNPPSCIMTRGIAGSQVTLCGECGTPSALKEVKTSSIQIGDHVIQLSSCVRNIGAYFDSILKMNDQVQHVCKSAWYHLHQIRKLQGYLTEDQLKTLIHAYVTSKLDTNNGLLCGAHKYQIAKLQLVQNAAAKMICGLRKFDRVTPSLYNLHWLPIEQCIIFKILLLVYKAHQVSAPSISRTYFFHIVHIIRASPFSCDHQMTPHFWIRLVLIRLHTEIGHSAMQALTTGTSCHTSFVNWIHCLVSRKN